VSEQKIGADNWLHILSHAITNYTEEGGEICVEEIEGEVRVVFTAVSLADGRLHPKFKKLAQVEDLTTTVVKSGRE
jgi:hypothetical protein